MGATEVAHGDVHPLGAFEIAHVSGALDHDQRRVWDRLLKLARNAERRACIVLTPDQQRGDSDTRQEVAQISLGHEGQLTPKSGGAYVGGNGGEQRHVFLRRIFREQSGKRGVELLG